jgi:hypothetical protein
VITFGCNDEGALGRDTSKEGSEMEPGKVVLEDRVVQITAGDSHTAALLSDGRVFAWGSFRVSMHLLAGLSSETILIWEITIVVHVVGLKRDYGPHVRWDPGTTHRNVTRSCCCEDSIWGRPSGYAQ